MSIRTKYVDYGCQKADNTYHIPPYRTLENKVEPIEFKMSHTELRQSGMLSNGTISVEPIRYCTYICRDKRILEYLRTHPLINIEFFENKVNNISKDVVKSQAVRDAAAMVNKMDNHQIIERIIQLGFTPTQDVNENRNTLISKLTEDILNHGKNVLEAALPIMNQAGDDLRKKVFQSKEQADTAFRGLDQLASASENFVS